MQSQKAIQTNQSSSSTSPVFVEAGKLVEQIQHLAQTVAKRAYEFFEERGHQIGNELEDWFRAEAELLRPVPVEMIEDENRFIIKAETPGFKAHEIKISAEPQRLIIEGQTEESLDEKSEKIVYSERRSNHFLRSFDLGAEIDPAQVAATLKDGLLEINMPKSSARQAVGVEVKSA